MELNQVHQIMLAAMLRIDAFCKENDIKYFFTRGTQLGALRHHGFIPWDDDVDIYMLPQDLKKFRSLFDYEMNDFFYLSNKVTEDEYYLSYDKIRILGTAAYDPRYEKFNVHQEMSIDIFPLYYLPDDISENKQFQKRLKRYTKICQLVELSCDYWQKSTTGKVGRMITKLFGLGCVNQRAVKLQNQLLAYKSSDVVIDPIIAPITYKSQWFDHPVYVDFESYRIPIANDSARCLQLLYGDWTVIPKDADKKDHSYLQYKITNPLQVSRLLDILNNGQNHE